jgi:hypothetical protein
MKRSLSLLAAGALMIGALGVANASAPKKVWSDAAGDIDPAATGQGLPGQAGFDLVGGSIARKGKNLVFTVQHAALPPFGAVPEAFRFMWGFSVNGKSYRVTVKRVEVGKPNPLNQEDTDQIGQVYPNGFFRLEGNCGSQVIGALNAVTCHTLGYLKGAWDPAKGTFSFEVPMKAVKANTGSKVAGGAGDAITICPICWVTHVAERSLDSSVIDEAAQTGVYKVPKK